MAVFVLFLVAIAAVSGSDLPPFLAWSNENSISQLGSTVKDVVNVLGASDVSTVIVFAFDKLSFDDIAKYGGAYGSQNELTHLQSSMDSAPFQYYGGMAQSSREWVSDLGKRLKKSPYYLAKQSMIEVDLNGKFVIVPLSSKDSFLSNDAAIGRLMEGLNTDATYFAICTELPPEIPIQVDEEVSNIRSARSVAEGIVLQADENGMDEPAFANEDCQIGGQLNFTKNGSKSDENACMLFCLSSPITFVPDTSNPNGTCTLKRPYYFAYNCYGSINNDSDAENSLSMEYGSVYPEVTLRYMVVENSANVGNLSAFNNCTDTMWDKTFNNDTDSKQLDIQLTFFFPMNFTYNNGGTHTRSNWAVMISSNYTKIYEKSSKDKPLTRPPDNDLEVDEEDFSERVLLIRNSSGLDQKFEVPSDNSYACSGTQYSVYVPANYTVGNDSVLDIKGPIKSSSNKTLSMVMLTFLQVQPYNVSNRTLADFASADNCVGYFTEATWMGIISMVILFVIFYLAILCAFSIQTLDQFEDPRGQTISVEKLH